MERGPAAHGKISDQMGFAITLPHALLAFVLLVCAAAPAVAQERDADLFIARGVAVEATAQSAAQARDAAILEGQRRALEIVLRRLTPPEAHDRLPSVDGASLATLVDGFLIEREKASATRYIADLTVEFRPRAVRDLLRGVGAPVLDRRPSRLLVLPVFQQDGRTVMFDDPNPWREAWEKVAGAGGLTPLVLPLGDLDDVAAVSPEQALAGDGAALAALARRHGAQRWAVVSARAEAGGLNVTLKRPEGTEVETLRGEPAAVMAEAAARLSGRIDAEWRKTIGQLAAPSAGVEAQLSVRATFADLADWIALRDGLGRNPAVRRLEVGSLTPREAQLVLHHRGAPELLAQALALDGLELQVEPGGGFWRIGRRGGAQAVR